MVATKFSHKVRKDEEQDQDQKHKKEIELRSLVGGNKVVDQVKHRLVGHQKWAN